MHVTDEVQQRGDREPEIRPSGQLPGGLARRFVRLWLLLVLAFVIARVASRYSIAGYIGMNRQAWAEIALIPLFQAGVLLALRETFRGWVFFRQSVRGILRHPALAVVLLLDLVLIPVLGWVQASLLYVYLVLRCLFVIGFAFSRRDRLKHPRGGSDASVFPACVILISLPLALIQSLRLLTPGRIYYPWLWSTLAVALGALLLNALGLWVAVWSTDEEEGVERRD